MEFSVRLARVSDATSVAKIWVEGQRAMPVHIEDRDYSEMFAAKIRNQTPNFPIWVAETEEGEVAGWQSLSSSISHPFLQQFFAESSTYIDPSTQARGVGRALLRHAIAYAAHTPLRYITAYIKTTNKVALRIVEQLGFACLGALPPPGEDGKVPHLVFFTYSVPHAEAVRPDWMEWANKELVGVETREISRSEIFAHLNAQS